MSAVNGSSNGTAKGSGFWLFASNFFKHPTMLGSIIPSSRHLIERLLAPVDWSRAKRVVEYGPGVATFTRALLERMPEDGELLVIELNEDFAHYVRERIHDPRLTVAHASAGELDRWMERLGWEGIDYIVSGIPFSTMPAHVRDEILRKTRDGLAEEGEFLVFQFSNAVFPYLKENFDEVDRGFELRNIPPAHCYRCRADGA
ncbi:class I SAM-dependent methyltransferase [Arhodomonas sp. SL1]|uniref:class I SAM-dependent methyltransferase n=1 Tax=Arhodomonas sp. SL1 TaxID=3425691 RepID=UPI003F882BFB